jgi:hypothetical protein
MVLHFGTDTVVTGTMVAIGQQWYCVSVQILLLLVSNDTAFGTDTVVTGTMVAVGQQWYCISVFILVASHLTSLRYVHHHVITD